MSPQPKRIEPGPATRRVIAQLIRIRTQRNLTYTEIADRLDDLGRPIPILGLRRIEAGQRRIDIDDLEALALVLGVPPLLLLYPVGTDVAEVGLLPDVRTDPWSAARWFTGEAGPPAGVDESAALTASPMVTGGPPDARFLLDRFRAHDALAERCVAARAVERPGLLAELVELRRQMGMLGITPPRLPENLARLAERPPIDVPAEPQPRRARNPNPRQEGRK